MEKFKKVLKIVLISLLVCLGIFSIVAYIVWKEQTTYIFECIIDFVNKPLPIVGVSIIIVGAFIYKCVVASRFGKKAINEYKQENDNLRHEIDKYKELVNETLKDYESALNQAKNELGELKEDVASAFELNKNYKVREIASKLRGVEYEKEIDSNPEEE